MDYMEILLFWMEETIFFNIGFNIECHPKKFLDLMYEAIIHQNVCILKQQIYKKSEVYLNCFSQKWNIYPVIFQTTINGGDCFL